MTAKRNGKGRFVPNPNSKRQKKLREQSAKKTAERRKAQGIVAPAPASPASPVESVDGPSFVAENPSAGVESVTDTDNEREDENATESTGSHTDSWFLDPAQPEPLIPDDFFENNDGSEDRQEDPPEEKESPAKKRRKQKKLAEYLVSGLDKGFSLYVDGRHDWIAPTINALRAAGKEGVAKSLETMSALSEEEREIVIDSLARYMEENGIELSPGYELLLLIGGMYGGRIMALETAMFAAKRSGKM